MRAYNFPRIGLPAFLLILVFYNSTPLAAQNTTIAVLDFEAKGISSVEVSVLADRLEAELVRSELVTVIERSRMRSILEEQNFQMTGCSSNECAVEVGQLLGVTHMVAGSIGKIGNTYSINLRTIDVGTGRIIQSVIRDYRGEIDMLLTEMTYVAGALANPGSEQDAAMPAAPPQIQERVTDQEEYRQWYPSLKMSYEVGDEDVYLLVGLGWRLTDRTGIKIEISAPSFVWEEFTVSGGLSRFRGSQYTNFLLGYDSYAGLLVTVERGLPAFGNWYILPSFGASTNFQEVDLRVSIGLALEF